MKTLFLWLGIAIALIGADHAVAGPEPIESKDFKAAPAPVVEQPCRWTGFYLGVHGGYGWGHANLEEMDDEDPGFGVDPDGFLGGGQIGFNLQLGSFFVIGIEGDIAGSDINESRHFTFADEPDETLDLHSDIDYIGTIGGRVGVTFWQNKFFLFFKGGVAFMNFDNVLREDDDGTIETFHDNDDLTTGYIGGGLEYAMTCHWSFMFEYKHYFIGDNGNVTHEVNDEGETKTFDRDRNLDSVLFGVNYKF